jgi:hypothetical protein
VLVGRGALPSSRYSGTAGTVIQPAKENKMVACQHCGAALPVQATLGWAHLMLRHGVTYADARALMQLDPVTSVPTLTLQCRCCRTPLVLAVDVPAAAA